MGPDASRFEELVMLKAVRRSVTDGQVSGVNDVPRLQFAAMGCRMIVSHHPHKVVGRQHVALGNPRCEHDDAEIGDASLDGLDRLLVTDAEKVDIGRKVVQSNELLKPRCGVVEVESDADGRPVSGVHPSRRLLC